MNENLISKVKHHFKKKSDSECEQAAIRVIITILLTSYFYFFKDSVTHYLLLNKVCIISIITAVLIFLLISLSKQPSFNRRVTSNFIDISMISFMIYLSDEVGSSLIFLYLWITFGNGFRFGNKHLLISLIFSVIGFSFIMFNNEYWIENQILSYGFIIGIIILSGYVSFLISKLYYLLQETKKANEAKSQFLANMSHEIRTPLNGIIAMAALLSKTLLNAKQKDYSATINASAKTLLALINDILDISKIEAGKINIEKVDFDLYTLINTTNMILAPQAHQKRLQFNTYISPEIPFLLHGDEQHLRQIIINLVNNAIKFTDKGYIETHVSYIYSFKNKIRLKFHIIDTGIGIDNENKHKLFDKFTQIDSSTTRKYGGTGLGMAIVKQLIKMMSGKIGFISKVGHGSHFWFELDFELQQVSSEENIAIENIRNNIVLIVNPIKKYSEAIETLLSTWKIHFDFANDSQDAIDKIRLKKVKNNPYNIIFVFKNHFDIETKIFINKLKKLSLYNGHHFILINTEMVSKKTKLNILKEGYRYIFNSTPDRMALLRAIYSLTIKNDTDSYDDLNKKQDDIIENLNILIGEDNETNQKVIKNILEQRKHNITIAENGKIVLHHLEKNKFDLIILDMHMPIMGGIETSKKYRLMYPSKNDIPIIILTANVTKEAIEECKKEKVDAYLTKPIEPEKLLHTINSLINKKETRKDLVPIITDIDNSKTIPIIDMSTLKSILVMEKKQGWVKNLINIYLKDASGMIEKIIHSIEKNNFHETANLAHTLDGSSRTIGAKRLAKIANKIFKLSKSNQYELIQNDIHHLNLTFDKTKTALLNFITDNKLRK